MSIVNDHREVRSEFDVSDLFAEKCVHLVELPASDDILHRLWTNVFDGMTPGHRLLITSPSHHDFSWELVNRLILAKRLLGNTVGDDHAPLVLPSLLKDPKELTQARPDLSGVVILVRRNLTPIADVSALEHVLTTTGFTIGGVVIVDCDRGRWRRWRRFAQNYGVGSDPDRPWPIIDVLEAEKRRTPRRDRCRSCLRRCRSVARG